MKVTAAVPDIFEVARTRQQPVHPSEDTAKALFGRLSSSKLIMLTSLLLPIPCLTYSQTL